MTIKSIETLDLLVSSASEAAMFKLRYDQGVWSFFDEGLNAQLGLDTFIKSISKSRVSILLLIDLSDDFEALSFLVRKLSKLTIDYNFVSKNRGLLKYLSVFAQKKCYVIDLDPKASTLYDIRLNDLGLCTYCENDLLSFYKNHQIDLFVIGDTCKRPTDNVKFYGQFHD